MQQNLFFPVYKQLEKELDELSYFIGRQPYSEGILSRAVHGVTFSFALDFLDLTTFLR